MKLLVIGSGMMGSAAAYDISRQPDIVSVTLADTNIKRAREVAARINHIHGGKKVKAVSLDASDQKSAARVMQGHKAALSAVPYFLNLALAHAAIEAGCHFADLGGNNYGDTMIKLQFNGSSFHVVDWFTPSNAACIDLHDLELGSGGVALLPTDVTNGRQIAIAYSKEGRLFLVNTDTMGKFNGGGDNQIAQEFMVGQYTCSDTVTADVAEGPGWNRLYGTPAYWNGNVYAGASSVPLQQYHFENGLLNPTPVATSATAYGLRGGNSVVSANGTQNGIVWSYEKSTSGQGILHAYDATNIATELWNSSMNSGRDGLGEGIGFGTPVVAEGRVIVPYDTRVGIFGLLQ